MRIAVIGAGYVGLTTALTLAYLGHEVDCIDQDQKTVRLLQEGISPLYEPGLSELLSCDLPLSFGDWSVFQAGYDLIFLTVGTPGNTDGSADLSFLEAAAATAAQLSPFACGLRIVIKSTVPPGTSQKIQALIARKTAECGTVHDITVLSNPEFLREGSALSDAFYPDRIIVGAVNAQEAIWLEKLYEPLVTRSFETPPFIPAPSCDRLPVFLVTSPVCAELIKYASNAFLAMKVSFINELAGLAECLGADITDISRGIGLDIRIGPSFLSAGPGWGGSCFGKDIRALLSLAAQYGYEMFLADATIRVNERQRQSIVKKLQRELKILRGATVGLLGISFKPDTDDVRDAPFLDIAARLLDLGTYVKAYDPMAMSACAKRHPALSVEYCDSPLELACGCDALVILTQWPEFTRLDLGELGRRMRRRLIIDGRNALDPASAIAAEFAYVGVGR